MQCTFTDYQHRPFYSFVLLCTYYAFRKARMYFLFVGRSMCPISGGKGPQWNSEILRPTTATRGGIRVVVLTVNKALKAALEYETTSTSTELARIRKAIRHQPSFRPKATTIANIYWFKNGDKTFTVSRSETHSLEVIFQIPTCIPRSLNWATRCLYNGYQAIVV